MRPTFSGLLPWLQHRDNVAWIDRAGTIQTPFDYSSDQVTEKPTVNQTLNLQTLRTAWLRRRDQRTDPYVYLLAGWMLVMISVPIVRWNLGDGAIPYIITASVVLLSIAVLAVLQAGWGARRTMQMAATVIVLSWGVEWLGSTTGFPFGSYDYTDRLVPQLAHVPLIIPLAWLTLLPPSWAMAAVITRRTRGLAFVVVSALAFTAWDLFVDPQMVSWGFWVWENPSGYFGIPWINFGGWFLTAALLTLAVRPSDLPQRPLIFVYVVTWALQSIGQYFFWDMPGPALAGCAGMGLFIILAWLRRQPESGGADCSQL